MLRFSKFNKAAVCMGLFSCKVVSFCGKAPYKSMRAVRKQYAPGANACFKVLSCLFSTGPWVSFCSYALLMNHVQCTLALCGSEDVVKVVLYWCLSSRIYYCTVRSSAAYLEPAYRAYFDSKGNRGYAACFAHERYPVTSDTAFRPQHSSNMSDPLKPFTWCPLATSHLPLGELVHQGSLA